LNVFFFSSGFFSSGFFYSTTGGVVGPTFGGMFVKGLGWPEFVPKKFVKPLFALVAAGFVAVGCTGGLTGFCSTTLNSSFGSGLGSTFGAPPKKFVKSSWLGCN
jgi:hypothetical protein